MPTTSNIDLNSSAEELVDYLVLSGQLTKIFDEISQRHETTTEAKKLGLKITIEELQQAADLFRISKGINKESEMQLWLKENNITLETFEDYLERNLLIEKLKGRQNMIGYVHTCLSSNTTGGHINILVDNIDSAKCLYEQLLGAEAVQQFPHFKNINFAKSAGFLDFPEKVEVSILYMVIPGFSIPIELMQYHWPKISKHRIKENNHRCGFSHIAIRVSNLDELFNRIKILKGVSLINESPNYRPHRMSKISKNQFFFYNKILENNALAKLNVCNTASSIRYFYCVDKYGVQWEFEEPLYSEND
jgi:maltose O-acetyltransferase